MKKLLFTAIVSSFMFYLNSLKRRRISLPTPTMLNI
jgi:hypothetical protein